MRQEGAKREDIALEVQRKDGSSPSLCTVDAVVARFEKDPEWDGCEERTAGGRPRTLTEEQLKKIHTILLRDVGKQVVSASYVKRLLKELRLVPDKTIQRSFLRLGYSYLYRRGKQAIGDKYKPARLAGFSSKHRSS